MGRTLVSWLPACLCGCFLLLGVGCSPELVDGGAAALKQVVDVEFTLVHVQGLDISGPEDEGLEMLADAVGAITTLPRTDAVILGGDLFRWADDADAAHVLETLELTGSVLSIVAAPQHALFTGADLGPAAARGEVLRFAERQGMLPARDTGYVVDLADGARMVVLGAGGAGLAVLREELASGLAPVVIVASPSEPTGPEVRALISGAPRVKCVLVSEERAEGRPADWPPVLSTPALAASERIRVVEVGAGALMSRTSPVFEGPPGDRFQAPLRDSATSAPAP
jgi:hypothetical protein